MTMSLRILDRQVFGRRVSLGAQTGAANRVTPVDESTEWSNAIAAAKRATQSVIARRIPRTDTAAPMSLVLARRAYSVDAQALRAATLATVHSMAAARVARHRAERAAALVSHNTSPVPYVARLRLARAVLWPTR